VRTHALSIAILHSQDTTWTVSVVQTTYKRGVIADARIVFGPLYVREDELDTCVSAAVKQLQKLVRDHEQRGAEH